MSQPTQATKSTLASKYAAVRDQIERDRLHAWSSAPNFIIAGVEVAPMSLRSMIDLELAGNAFVCGGEPIAGDVAAYIWRHHPDFGDDDKRRKFTARIATAQNVEQIIADIIEHRDCAMEDSPATAQFGGTSIDNRISPLPSVAAICHEYGATFSVDPRAVADIDLRIVFQSCRAIRIQNGAKYTEPKRLREIKSEYLKAHGES